jgi:hypothetical protein
MLILLCRNKRLFVFDYCIVDVFFYRAPTGRRGRGRALKPMAAGATPPLP